MEQHLAKEELLEPPVKMKHLHWKVPNVHFQPDAAAVVSSPLWAGKH